MESVINIVSHEISLPEQQIHGLCGQLIITKKGVHTGRYFSNQMDAEWEFASLAFSWFQDNVSINFTAETVD